MRYFCKLRNKKCNALFKATFFVVVVGGGGVFWGLFLFFFLFFFFCFFEKGPDDRLFNVLHRATKKRKNHVKRPTFQTWWRLPDGLEITVLVGWTLNTNN